MVASTPISTKQIKKLTKNLKPSCETRRKTDPTTLRDIVTPRQTLTQKTKARETWTSKLESKLKRHSRYHTNFKQKLMKPKHGLSNIELIKTSVRQSLLHHSINERKSKTKTKTIRKLMSKFEQDLIGQTEAS